MRLISGAIPTSAYRQPGPCWAVGHLAVALATPALSHPHPSLRKETLTGATPATHSPADGEKDTGTGIWRTGTKHQVGAVIIISAMPSHSGVPLRIAIPLVPGAPVASIVVTVLPVMVVTVMPPPVVGSLFVSLIILIAFVIVIAIVSECKGGRSKQNAKTND